MQSALDFNGFLWSRYFRLVYNVYHPTLVMFALGIIYTII